ncbi:MAG: histidine--tRNA ligase [Candidatus Omnitrophica bacterium]|nr:histidine--tRNA ligase [Candidatus Omnitrophota bacterium]
MRFQRLRGTHDIVGQDAAVFQGIESAAREVFPVFDFEEIRTPVMEERELFTRALGTETDVVQKEMYEFEDRSKTKIALRPEGTAGIVRAYLENNFDKTRGLCKFYYLGPMFRSERPQAGRLRQFHQIGVEQLGAQSPFADAETLQSLTVFLNRAGVSDFTVKLNNLGTFEERQTFKEKLKKYLEPNRAQLCEDCRRRLEKNALRVLDCKIASCRKLIGSSPSILDDLTPESREHFTQVGRLLKRLGIAYQEDPRMVRGLDYYTKTVFEVSHPKLGAQDALAAGGRYDHLIEQFGGPAVGAVGFAVGVERLAMCLTFGEEEKLVPSASVFIATLGEKALEKGFELLSDLRKNAVRAAMDFEAKSLKSQMRSADKAHASFVVILGEDELERGKAVLKDMRNGSQEETPFGEVIRVLKEKVSSHA